MIASSKSTAYHHGNLRQALLNAARELAKEQTVDAMTLREVARRAGVSHAAPYHHFSDKRALLKALALEAHKDLKVSILEHLKVRTEQPLHAIGIAYVQYALEHPTEFRFMFRKSLCEPPGVHDELTETANQSLERLTQTIRELQAAGSVVQHEPSELALVVWSAMHGLADLLIEAPILSEPITPNQLERLVQLVMTTVQQGFTAPEFHTRQPRNQATDGKRAKSSSTVKKRSSNPA